jgi:hypothetical protein
LLPPQMPFINLTKKRIEEEFMLQESKAPNPSALSSVIENCLPKLQAISLALDTYGAAENAAMLHDVIEQLQKAIPAGSLPSGSMDFIVNATFKVSRHQVAAVLWHAFGSEITWLKVVEVVEPPTLRFRSIEHTIVCLVDYPLNEGGSLGIVSREPSSDLFRLDLKSLAQGLDALATKYPRHFADLINGNTDTITANALLQCCLFGELIYE